MNGKSLDQETPLIRPAILPDAEALASCIDAAYAKYAHRLSDMPSVSDGCAEDILNLQVWVALRGDVVIAGLFLAPQDGFMKLANLAVHPNHAGKGIGRRLIELAEGEAKRQGFGEMRLNTHVGMPENIKLYSYLGWVETSRRGNTVSMRKQLRDN